MTPSPHVVFIPGGGSSGVGESMRSFIVADALHRRCPSWRIGFITDERHLRLPYDGFERHRVSGQVSKSVAEVNRLLEELTPDVVVFDSRGRGDHVARASHVGARTVYVAAQPRTLERALRWRRLRHLDELWVVNSSFRRRRDRLAFSQRMRVRLARGPEIRFFDSILPLADPQRSEALQRRLGLEGEPYILFAPGGGGFEDGGRPVSELFAEAAQRLQRASGIRCVAVMGPLYQGGLRSLEGITILDSVEPAEMIGLLAGARLVVCGGGGVIGQALVLEKVCVAVPAGGSDQPERIRRCAQQGLLEATSLDPGAIARLVRELLQDPAREGELLARIRRVGPRNGLPEALRHLAGLVDGLPVGAVAD